MIEGGRENGVEVRLRDVEKTVWRYGSSDHFFSIFLSHSPSHKQKTSNCRSSVAVSDMSENLDISLFEGIVS